MNEQNKKYLLNLIKSNVYFLLNKLPDHPNHPKGRNPYAHVALKVKNEFGSSYKDIPDEKINDVVNYLNSIKKNEG